MTFIKRMEKLMVGFLFLSSLVFSKKTKHREQKQHKKAFREMLKLTEIPFDFYFINDIFETYGLHRLISRWLANVCVN
jgi:hypothetical protein